MKENFKMRIKLKVNLDPNANQFVNQGYNNIDFPPQSSARPFTPVQTPVQKPMQQQQQFQQPAGTRIIPIQVERSPLPNDQTVAFPR